MTDTEENPILSAICAACKEQIHMGATICKHCGTHQTWRHHVNLSANVLALFVALISVTTVFISVIQSGTARSDIRVIVNHEPSLDFDVDTREFIRVSDLIRVDGYYVFVIRLVLMNTGTRPGAVSQASVEVMLDGNVVTGLLEFPPSQAAMTSSDYRVVELRIPLDTSTQDTFFKWFKYEQAPTLNLKVLSATLTFNVISNSGEMRVQEIAFGPFESKINLSDSREKEPFS